MTVETRVIIDADAKNAIREIDKLDTAAGDADKTLKELDGADIDVDAKGAVTDLGRVETAAGDAMGAVDKLDAQAVHIDIDVDADKLDTVKRKTDDIGDSGRAGSTAIGGIGNAVSELPGVGALGPIAESLGQLTENALEGGESIAGIGKAVGVLGGTAIVMMGIQKAMASIAETDAFNEEQVESFRDALKETGDAAQAVLDTIREAEGVQGRTGGILGAFEGTKEISPILNRARISADEWADAVTKGGRSLERVNAKLRAYQDRLKEQRLAHEAGEAGALDLFEAYNDVDGAIEITSETLANNSKAATENAELQKFLATSTRDTAQSAAELAAAEEDARIESLEMNSSLKLAADEMAVALDDGPISKLEQLRGLLDIDQLMSNFRSQANETAKKYRAGVALSEEDTLSWKQTIFDTAAELANVPDDIIVDMIAQADDGLTREEVASQAWIMQQYANNNPIKWKVQLDAAGLSRQWAAIPPSVAAPGAATTGPTQQAAAPTTNRITVNLPRAAEARDVVAALDRWTRVNG